jgi:hypothetical protein
MSKGALRRQCWADRQTKVNLVAVLLNYYYGTLSNKRRHKQTNATEALFKYSEKAQRLESSKTKISSVVVSILLRIRITPYF